MERSEMEMKNDSMFYIGDQYNGISYVFCHWKQMKIKRIYDMYDTFKL